ncbi:MAG TPA: trypsin-like peptidase domain-containing protein, partial [Anaerolineales bacterium]
AATAVATASPAQPATQPPAALSQAQAGNLAAYEAALENIYTQVNPGVVYIRVLSNSSGNSPFGVPGHPVVPGAPGGQGNGQNGSQGLVPVGEASGWVWDSQGYIVTNNHVVDGADKVEVTFSDGSVATAKVIGTDVNSDLAVIQVNVAAGQLHPLTLGDSTQVKVGQLAIAIGNPFGLSGTMTTGIISNVGQQLPVSSSATQTGSSYQIPDIIQTDASINPGNSGGVLVNDQGQVIGVTAAIESSTQSNSGIGFAIPSAIVQKVIPALIKDGKYDHPYIGISGTNLNPDLAAAMKLPEGQRGALVEEVTAGGPAEKAGLQGSTQQATINGQATTVGGDVITAIDGQDIRSIDALIAYLFSHTEVGQKITVTFLRGGEQKTAEVTLGARPAQTSVQQPASPTQASPSGTAYLGISSVGVNADIAQAMSLPAGTQGVLVVQVAPGSPAEKAGLKAGTTPLTINGQEIPVGGDVITAIDGQAITSTADLRATLGQDKPNQQVTLSLLRGGQTTQVQVTLGSR